MIQALKPKFLLILVTTLMLVAGLSACGQKGDLYHPEQERADKEKPGDRS